MGAVHLEREVLHQLADEGTLGVEDRQAAADLRREVEEVELEPELAVVAALRLGKPVEMRGERRLGLPGGAVDSLQLRAVLVAAPVRTGDAGQLEMAEAARPRYVRPAAQVDEVRAVAVRRHHRRARGGLGGELGVDPTVRRGDALDDLAFERLRGEEREPLLDRAHLAHEGLVRDDDRAHRRLDRRQVLVGEAPVLGQLEVVVETVLDRRPDREARPREESEHRLRHHVRRGVAEDGATFVDSPGDDPHDVAVVEHRAEVGEDPVHLGDHGVGRQSLADRRGEIGRRRSRDELAASNHRAR